MAEILNTFPGDRASFAAQSMQIVANLVLLLGEQRRYCVQVKMTVVLVAQSPGR